jgi:hypothetical protein
MPSVLLSCFAFAVDDVASSPLGGFFGIQAIFLHTNQLVVPVLFGWRLRDHLNAALAGSPGQRCNIVAPHTPPPPSPLPSPPRVV